MDQRPAGDLRRRGRAGGRRRGDADRRARQDGRDAGAHRRRFRRFAPCRPAGARQRPPSFLPDADARPSFGDQQAALPLAQVALPDLVAPQAAPSQARDPACADRTPHVGLHDRGRPSLSLPEGARGRGRHRSRRNARPRHAHDGVARLDEPVGQGRGPAARQRGAGRGDDSRRQRAGAEKVPRSEPRFADSAWRSPPVRRSRSPRIS